MGGSSPSALLRLTSKKIMDEKAINYESWTKNNYKTTYLTDQSADCPSEVKQISRFIGHLLLTRLVCARELPSLRGKFTISFTKHHSNCIVCLFRILPVILARLKKTKRAISHRHTYFAFIPSLVRILDRSARITRLLLSLENNLL